MSHTPEPWTPNTFASLSNGQVHETYRYMLPPRDYLHAIKCVNASMGLNPTAYRDCVEALQSLVKFSSLYLTSSEEARQRSIFGQQLTNALPQAIQEAKRALAHSKHLQTA